MKNKSNILTSVMLALSAIFVPNNMRADEEAQKLLKALKDAEPAQRDPGIMNEAVKQAKSYLMERNCLPSFGEDVWELCLTRREWESLDSDMVNLIKYMLTLDLGWSFTSWFLPSDWNIGGVRNLNYIGKDIPSDVFFEQLKNARALKRLQLCCTLSEKDLTLLADVISKSNLEYITLSNASSSMEPIAKALLTKSLGKLELRGEVEISPLFTTHDQKTEGTQVVVCFPQLGILDLFSWRGSENTLERLRSNPEQKFYLPQELKMRWDSCDIYSVDLCKELVGRGLNLKTLVIDCYEMDDARVSALIEMMEQNRRNGGILSKVNFCQIFYTIEPPVLKISEEKKKSLEKALKETGIALDGWILERLCGRPVAKPGIIKGEDVKNLVGPAAKKPRTTE